MRIGELLALTYNDINLEEKTISINKSYQRLKGKDMITQPKTPKSIRVITMPDFLAEEFREYCSHLYGIMKKERLFSVYQIAYGTLYGYRNRAVWCKADTTS